MRSTRVTRSPRPSPGWGDRSSSVVCSSEDRRYHECQVPFRGTARIANQISDAACIEGRTWGQKPGLIWVDDGCRARFGIVHRLDKDTSGVVVFALDAVHRFCLCRDHLLGLLLWNVALFPVRREPAERSPAQLSK